MKALIVDDSRAMRMVIARLLQHHDFTIVEVSNGREALDAMEQVEPFDLALVDWNMPVMDGLAFVLAVRADRRFDAMAIMMVTTESEEKQVERAISAGASEYLMKPFSPETFAEKLASMGLAAA